jgi:hypothetical protein
MATYNQANIYYADPRTTYDGTTVAPYGGDWSVQIGFDLAANGLGNWFTLDDATKGVLDNVTYLLAGDVLVDVTGFARSINVKRGRSRTLEKFTAATCQIVLDNRDRAYDPSNADSPYFGSILPRKEVRVYYLGQPVFTGLVEDWNFDYTINGDATATVSCLDGFATINAYALSAGTATSQASGARVTAVLDTIGWPSAKRGISTGVTTLAADVRQEGTSALAYLQQVETSENGALFMSKDGSVKFRDRTDLASGTSAVTFGPSGIPFTNVAVVWGTEELVNSVSVVWSAGTVVGGTAVVEDTASQAAYGVIDQSYDTLLNSNAQALTLGSAIIATYAQPQLRVDQVMISMPGASSAAKSALLGIELTDRATVNWTPNSMGSALNQIVVIDGIEHSATPANHEMTFTMSEA